VLRIWHPALSIVGLTAGVVLVPGAMMWWFRASTGDLLGPCGDESVAVHEIARLPGPWGAAAHAVGKRAS
jgi:hypothetical protein